MKTITTEYTLKVWKTDKDWDDGTVEFRPFTKKDKESPIVIAGLHGQIMSGEILSFEVFNTETGETVIHSEE